MCLLTAFAIENLQEVNFIRQSLLELSILEKFSCSSDFEYPNFDIKVFPSFHKIYSILMQNIKDGKLIDPIDIPLLVSMSSSLCVMSSGEIEEFSVLFENDFIHRMFWRRFILYSRKNDAILPPFTPSNAILDRENDVKHVKLISDKFNLSFDELFQEFKQENIMFNQTLTSDENLE